MKTIESITCRTDLHYLKSAVITDENIKRFFVSMGKQLRALRAYRKISVEKFIEDMKISEEQLAIIENGDVWVEPEFYQKAAQACGKGMSARMFIDSISAHELPSVLTKHRNLILDSLPEKDRVNFEQYRTGCISAAKQYENIERKLG